MSSYSADDIVRLAFSEIVSFIKDKKVDQFMDNQTELYIYHVKCNLDTYRKELHQFEISFVYQDIYITLDTCRRKIDSVHKGNYIEYEFTQTFQEELEKAINKWYRKRKVKV